MSLKGTINDETIVTKSGNSGRTGKPYSIREQSIMLDMPNGERVKHSLSLEHDELPLIKGNYVPKPTAFFRKGFDLICSSRARDWQKVA